MAESIVPNLNAALGPTVLTATGAVTAAGFVRAVVQEVTGPAATINALQITEQSPQPGSKLTTGEVMHLYVSAGLTIPTTSAPSPTGGPAGVPRTYRNLAIIQLVIILALLAYIFAYCR